jgi:hypothetical protein
MTTNPIRVLQARLGVPVDGIYGPVTQAAHQAHLDQVDTTPVPNITPPAALPWWRSRAVLGWLAVALAWGVSRYGLTVDSAALTEWLVSATEVAGAGLALWGTWHNRAPIDPTLVARVADRDVRLPVSAYQLDPPRDKPGPLDAH